MSRYFLAVFLLCTFCITCKGQTFQYSRGWTNGKRGGAALEYNHNFPNLQSNDDATNKWNKLIKFPYLPTDVETTNKCNIKMMSCLVKMQQILRNLFIPKVGMNWLNRHDDTDCLDFYQTNSQGKQRDIYYEIPKLNKSAGSNVDEVLSASDDYEHH